MAQGISALRDALRQALREQHQVMRDLIQGLDVAALNWSPGPEMNSIAVLYAHLLDAERFLLAAALGETVQRDREAAFRYRAPDAAALLQLIDSVETESMARVDRLTEADLAAVRAPAGDRLNRRFPGAWWVLHALGHDREHIGQAMLTRQLYEQRAR
jgi:hypothetical protein